METENTQTTNSQSSDNSGSSKTVVMFLVLGILLLGGYYVYENFFKNTEVADDTDMAPTMDYSDVSGSYMGTAPSADSVGREYTMLITQDGRVMFSVDYMNGQPAIPQEGVLEGEDILVVTQIDGGRVNPPTEIPIEFIDNGLILGRGTAEYGSNGVTMMKGEETMVPGTDNSNSTDSITANPWMWKDTQMSNDEMVTPTNPAQFVLTFMPNGTFSTTTDCNSGSGSYTMSDDGSLTFGPVASTKMFCEGSQETEYYMELGEVASYMIQDGNLYLSMKMDSGTMEFTPVSN